MEETSAQLAAVNGRAVTTSRDHRSLGVRNPAATWHMENWYRPVRAWYRDESVGTDYRSGVAPGTMVLEIGLLCFTEIVRPLVRTGLQELGLTPGGAR